MQGKHAEAERIYREMIDVQRRMHGEEHLSTLATANHLATCISMQGKHAEADREMIGVQRRVLGEEHPHTQKLLNDLALSLSEQRKFVKAEQIFREVLDVQRRMHG
jgi:hypothetical protein